MHISLIIKLPTPDLLEIAGRKVESVSLARQRTPDPDHYHPYQVLVSCLCELELEQLLQQLPYSDPRDLCLGRTYERRGRGRR